MKRITPLGALLALILVAFPLASARATQCDPVSIYWEYGGPSGLMAEMETDTPTPRTIFYTMNGTTPTHTGGTPGSGTYIYSGAIVIPWHSWKFFRAVCYKSGYDDSDVAAEDISNPIQ